MLRTHILDQGWETEAPRPHFLFLLIKFYWTQPCPSIYTSALAHFLIPWQSWVVGTEITWPVKPKLCILYILALSWMFASPSQHFGLSLFLFIHIHTLGGFFVLFFNFWLEIILNPTESGKEMSRKSMALSPAPPLLTSCIAVAHYQTQSKVTNLQAAECSETHAC